MRPGKNSWYPQGSGNLPATLLPFRSSLFIVGRLKGGTPCCTNFLAYRASRGSARCFFSIGVSRNMHGRCRRDYGCIALRCRIRLTGQFTASNCRRAADGTSPQGRLRRVRAGPPPLWRPGAGSRRFLCSADCTFVTRGGTMFGSRGAASAVRACDAPSSHVAPGAAPPWCAMPRGFARRGAKTGGYRGVEQGTFLAKHSVRRSGMRNAGENDRWRKDR